jgi:hypothetical protein
VSGPLDPSISTHDDVTPLFSSVRIVCPDLASLQKALRKVKDSKVFKIKSLQHNLDKARTDPPAGYRGVVIRLVWQDKEKFVQLITQQQLRWLLWSKKIYLNKDPKIDQKQARPYALAVSFYLDALDHGKSEAPAPKASDYGLPEQFDLYSVSKADPPSVPGGINKYLKDHAEISTDFARGITGFIPTDSTLAEFQKLAPEEAYFDQDEATLQASYRMYFEDGGDLRSIRTLTASIYNTLAPAQYAFAVGLNRSVRICREPEKEISLSSQQLLFPGEPVLAAGYFTIGMDSNNRLTKIDAFSSHFFYSEISPSLQVDIATHSSHYFMTLGHFFKALSRTGVSPHNVLITKF